MDIQVKPIAVALVRRAGLLGNIGFCTVEAPLAKRSVPMPNGPRIFISDATPAKNSCKTPRHFVSNKDTSFVYKVIDLTYVDDAATVNDDVAGTTIYPASQPPDAAASDATLHRLRGRIRWLSNTTFTFDDDYHNATTKVVVRKVGSGWSTLRPERR